MSALQLNAIVMKALVDPDFRENLLNGQRRTCLAQFDLDEPDLQALLEIRAGNLEQFVDAVSDLVMAEKP
jgi:hypothetical protein